MDSKVGEAFLGRTNDEKLPIMLNFGSSLHTLKLKSRDQTDGKMASHVGNLDHQMSIDRVMLNHASLT